MTIIYPINGKNQRLGELFRTPKHLLLYKGVPALVASVNYMKKRFPTADIVLLVNERYIHDIPRMRVRWMIAGDTESQVDTLRLATHNLKGSVMFVDCDIVPENINDPAGNTVYLFENKKWMKQYSNYEVQDGKVIRCNEKDEYHPYAGAGLYHFSDAQEFHKHSEGCQSISQVVNKLNFNADTTSQIFRFGTLNDIKNDERIANGVY